ncbi:hypothetical protein [Microcella sp.]|uniref:hypothetical protein n=1 Tax=Microcella sp. TaxID=1913979 RepID=UPI00256054F5|nr:hypothetical protein [Microcella sp.]MBX9471547.1 hypothetical protein [Microcella sp.]
MNSPLQLRTALLHALTALGATLFIVFHTYVYLGMLAAGASGGHDHDHDHDHVADEHGHGHLENLVALTDVSSASTWQFVIFFALLVVPTALTLIARGRFVAGIAFVTALIMATLNVVDGFIHGAAEGAWAATILALVAVGLPAVLAAMSHVAWLRSLRPDAPAPTIPGAN